jgi:F0F1-type ATP synthase assembly protein I
MVPFLLAAGPLVGFFMGSLLDRWFGTDPWLRWIFLALGFGAGVKEVARLLRRAARDMDRL